ncbi:MAG: aminoacyl-tRNA hydrolase [Gammaproteobacteria bacterium]|nr:aminoacyl-tRNA hydrolase [Gammaproteobacteria bacterium]
MIEIALIVGLGNPGAQYEQTRHNAGFWFVDAIAHAHRATFRGEPKFAGDIAKITLQGRDVWLLKPNIFMNRSGQAVAALSRFYKIAPEQILVVHDELDLDPGIARLKQGGGHGGHNGLRDIVAQLGSSEFKRLRIGIGRPPAGHDVSNFVLSRAGSEEQRRMDDAIAAAQEVVPLVIGGDFEKAMNRLNARK